MPEELTESQHDELVAALNALVSELTANQAARLAPLRRHLPYLWRKCGVSVSMTIRRPLRTSFRLSRSMIA